MAAPAIEAASTRRRGWIEEPICLGLVALDEGPIRFEAETGLVADMQMAVAQFGVLLKQAVGERVAVMPAMRLDAKGAARQCEHEMAMDLRHAVRRDDDAMLLGQRGDAQGLGKAGGARRVELHITDAAGDNEVADREAGQFALAMRQGDRRRRGEPREIG